MKRNNTIFNCFLLLPLVLATSCKVNKDTVSLFLYTNDDEFINDLSIKLKLEFEKDYNVQVYSAGNKQITQNKQIVDSFENFDNKLLVVNTVDRLSAKSIMEYSNKKETPVIFINRQPLVSDIKGQKNVYYVGTDPIYEGKAQAEIVDELFGGPKNFELSKYDKNKDGKVQVVLFKGEQGHQDAELRSANSLKTLYELNYNIELLQTDFYDWSENVANLEFPKTYSKLLNDDGSSKIELILSNNDEMAIGCAKYLTTIDNYSSQKTIMEQFFPIIGVDGTEYGINAIKYGLIYGTVQNNSSIQTDAISKLGRRLINKESLENFPYVFEDQNFIRTKGSKITYENIMNNFKK